MDEFSTPEGRTLSDALTEQGPAWRMGVMLAAMRNRGWSFDRAWSSAIQRMRIAPDMRDEEIAELVTAKFWINWAKPRYQWAYTGEIGVPPPLPKLDDDDALAAVPPLPPESLGARLSAAEIADDLGVAATAEGR